jgi:hypothetical protein
MMPRSRPFHSQTGLADPAKGSRGRARFPVIPLMLAGARGWGTGYRGGKSERNPSSITPDRIGFIHIFEQRCDQRCIASSFRFRFDLDRRFIAAPPLPEIVR